MEEHNQELQRRRRQAEAKRAENRKPREKSIPLDAEPVLEGTAASFDQRFKKYDYGKDKYDFKTRY